MNGKVNLISNFILMISIFLIWSYFIFYIRYINGVVKYISIKYNNSIGIFFFKMKFGLGKSLLLKFLLK